MKVNIGFLKSGLVRGVDAPEDFQQWLPEMQVAWADEHLRAIGDKELILALTEVPVKPDDVHIRSGVVIFDEAPLAAVIEQGAEEKPDYGEGILLTQEWQAYYRERKLIVSPEIKEAAEVEVHVLTIVRNGEVVTSTHASWGGAVEALIDYATSDLVEADDLTGNLRKDFEIIQAIAKESEDTIVEIECCPVLGL